MLKMLFISLLLGSLIAHADMKVNLKSAQLYPCNAGIQKSLNSDFGRDGISAKYEDLTQSVDNSFRYRQTELEGVSAGAFDFLFSGNVFWATKITQFNLNLSSEKMGAKYFIDYCYVAPQASGVQVQAHYGIYQMTNQLSIRSLGDSRYADEASLSASVYVYCDLTNQGSKTKLDADIANLVQSGLEKDLSIFLGKVSAAGALIQFEKLLNSNYQKIPRACVVRVLYSENSGSVRSQKVGVEFTNDITIEKSNY